MTCGWRPRASCARCWLKHQARRAACRRSLVGARVVIGGCGPAGTRAPLRAACTPVCARVCARVCACVRACMQGLLFIGGHVPACARACAARVRVLEVCWLPGHSCPHMAWQRERVVCCRARAGRSRKQKLEVDRAHVIEQLTINGKQFVSKQVRRARCAARTKRVAAHCTFGLTQRAPLLPRPLTRLARAPAPPHACCRLHAPRHSPLVHGRWPSLLPPCMAGSHAHARPRPRARHHQMRAFFIIYLHPI